MERTANLHTVGRMIFVKVEIFPLSNKRAQFVFAVCSQLLEGTGKAIEHLPREITSIYLS